jgi:hypothetical protein
MTSGDNGSLVIMALRHGPFSRRGAEHGAPHPERLEEVGASKGLQTFAGCYLDGPLQPSVALSRVPECVAGIEVEVNTTIGRPAVGEAALVAEHHPSAHSFEPWVIIRCFGGTPASEACVEVKFSPRH